MRVNVYAEEMTNRLQIIGKEIEGQKFTGLRFYLELPATINGVQHQGPFMHHPGDDDSSAVTFWGKSDLRGMLSKAQQMLDDHYGAMPSRELPANFAPIIGKAVPGQGGILAAIMRGPTVDGVEQPPYALLISHKDTEVESCKWGTYGKEIEGAASRTNGHANTAAMLAADCPAATAVRLVQADGHHDFYLPSLGELNAAAANVPEQFEADGVYWTSTQYSRHYAFVQDFEDGYSHWDIKHDEYRVRAVRRIQLQHFNA